MGCLLDAVANVVVDVCVFAPLFCQQLVGAVSRDMAELLLDVFMMWPVKLLILVAGAWMEYCNVHPSLGSRHILKVRGRETSCQLSCLCISISRCLFPHV